MTDLMDRPVRRAPGDRPRIDPRIAQRWVDARRQEGRRRLRILAAVASLAVVAALAAGSLFTPIFAAGHVHVTVTGASPGAPTVGAARVELEAGLAHQPLMIDIDPAAVARRLDADPLLGAARVSKHWPGTVTVTVVERTPLAQVAVGTAPGATTPSYVRVDPTGRVLGGPGAQVVGLPVIAGTGPAPAAGGWIAGSAGPAAPPAGGPAAVADMTAPADGPDVPHGAAAALAFLQALPTAVRSAVQTVTAGPGNGVSLVIAPPRVASGTVTVTLGDGSQLAAKAQALATLMTQADLGGVTSIDLSVPARPAATVSGRASSAEGGSPAASGSAGPG